MADMPTPPCPRCRGSIEQVTPKGATLDRCTSCGGIWFDAGELTLSVEILRPLHADDFAHGKPTDVPCFRCPGKKLLDVAFPKTDVRILACAGCTGSWLDRGKMEDLRAALRAIVGEPGTSPSGDRAAEILAELHKAERGVLCPRCDLALETYTHKGQILDRCQHCHGVWFDAGELTAELEISRKVSLQGAKAQPLACPRCPRASLVAVLYPRTTLEILVCPDCRGTWCDEGRLDQLRAATRPAG